jgi:hypothetical protein
MVFSLPVQTGVPRQVRKSEQGCTGGMVVIHAV